MKKLKIEDENQDSDIDQEALLIEERDSATPTRGEDGTLDKPNSVSESLSNDECG